MSPGYYILTNFMGELLWVSRMSSNFVLNEAKVMTPDSYPTMSF